MDYAGQHSASLVAKIGVDAVMTLLTKKVADEIGKGIDNLNQVDEVHAHHDPDINAGNLDNAEVVNTGQVNDADNVSSDSNTSIERRQLTEPLESTKAASSSAIIPAAPSGMSDNLVDIRSTLDDNRVVEAFDNMFGKMRGDSANMERAVEGIRKKGTDLEGSMLSKWEKANRTAFGAAVKQIPDALSRGQKLRDEVQVFVDANPQIKGTNEWFRRIKGETDKLNELQRGTKETTPEKIQGTLNNFSGIEAEFRYAQKQPGVIGVGQKMTLNGEPDMVDIDVVADNGKTWIDNKNVKPFSLESSSWKGKKDRDGLKKQAEKQLRSAQQNPIDGVPPKVVIEFPQGVSREIAQKLQKMGVEVKGNVVDR